jgi:hypothetical protein
MKLGRRTVLAGGTAAVVAVAVGGAAVAFRSYLPGTRTAESEAADYAKLLADVRDDYVNGRVVEHDGWVLSQHEFDTLDARQAEKPVRPATGIS